MGSVITSPPDRLPHAYPVGGRVSRTGKTLLLDKAFHQGQVVAIDPLPIPTQSMHSPGQQRGSQTLDLNPRENDKALIIDHGPKMVLPGLNRPTNELIARADLPGRWAKAQTGQRSVLQARNVFELSTRGLLIAQVVIGSDQALVEGQLLGVSD